MIDATSSSYLASKGDEVFAEVFVGLGLSHPSKSRGLLFMLGRSRRRSLRRGEVE